MKRNVSVKSTTIRRKIQPENINNKIMLSPKYQNSKMAMNSFKTRSLNCSPECIKTKKKIICLDVGLLTKQRRIKKTQTPRCIHSEQTKTSHSRESKKQYSINKITNDRTETQKTISPFVQFENYASQTKPFLLKKLNHQKHLANTIKNFNEIQLKQIEEQSNSMMNQSIFSFDILIKTQEKQQTYSNIFVNQSNKPKKQQMQKQGGQFYKRIRRIIDNKWP